MANKTVIKLLLSKFAPLSVDMQRAVITDQSVINNAETIDVTYIDNLQENVNKEEERIALMIQDATNTKELMAIKPHIEHYPDLSNVYEIKFSELLEKEGK